MQHHKFENGSFVIHHIAHIAKRHISAWYDGKGGLIDCEYVVNGCAINIDKRHTRVLSDLKRLPKIYGYV